MPITDRKLRVFLCHSSQDKPIVRELYQRLLAEGWIDPWLDEEKLLPGQDWDMEIEKAVEAADAVIVCLSNNSVSKEGYVQRELRFVLDIALEKPEGAIFIVPLRLDDCQPPRRLRIWQFVDYFPKERQEKMYQRMLESFKLRVTALGFVPTIKPSALSDRFFRERLNISTDVLRHVSDKNAKKIFISYSHKDEKYKDELVNILSPLQDEGILEIWHDRRVDPGDEWYQAIQDAMNICDLGILLISADFLTSRFIRDEELTRLLERHKENGLRVVPIIIRPCMWQSKGVLKDIQALPRDGKSVSMSIERDQVWTECAMMIERLLK